MDKVIARTQQVKQETKRAEANYDNLKADSDNGNNNGSVDGTMRTDELLVAESEVKRLQTALQQVTREQKESFIVLFQKYVAVLKNLDDEDDSDMSMSTSNGYIYVCVCVSMSLCMYDYMMYRCIFMCVCM